MKFKIQFWLELHGVQTLVEQAMPPRVLRQCPLGCSAGLHCVANKSLVTAVFDPASNSTTNKNKDTNNRKLSEYFVLDLNTVW